MSRAIFQRNLSAALHSAKFFLGFLWHEKSSFIAKPVMAIGLFGMFGLLGAYLGLYDFHGEKKSRLVPADTSHAVAYFWIAVLLIYLFRSDDRVTYGIVELFYATLAFIIFYKSQSSFVELGPFMVVAGSCIYVAVRGLDNVLGGVRNRLIEYQANHGTPAKVAR